MNCAPNGYQFPLPENVEALRIIDKYVIYFLSGSGGLNFDAIDLALKIEGKEELHPRLKIYLASALYERSRKREPVKQFKNKRGRK